MGANIPTLEYYFGGRGFTTKLSVWESGIGGRNRIVEVEGRGVDIYEPIIGDNFSSKVAKYLYPIEYLKKDFDKLAWRESEYGEDAFLFQYLATQAAILRRQKVWFGTSNQSTIWTDSEMNDKTLSEWWGGDIVKNKNSNEFKSKYFEQSINETDLKWRKTYTYTPPYFEIIQDPYVEPVDQIDKNKLELRRFGGLDPYYLNNGAKVVIEWSKQDGYFVGGDSYSDNWQRELNGYDIGKIPLDQISKKITIWGLSSSFTLAEEVNDSGSKDIGFLDQKELIFNEDQKILFRKKDFKGLYDDEIIKQVVDKWRLVYSNEKLALTERWDYYGNIKPTLEFISPVLSTIIGTGPSASLITTSASVATSSTGITGATGASASRIHGSYIFDVTKTGYLINIDLGELTILEKESIEDPFIANNFEQTDDYGNVVGLSSEYIENEYSGESEFEQMESPPTEEKKQEDAKVVDKLQNSEPVNVGNHKLDLIPGEFVTNGGVKIKCCQIDGNAVNVKIAGAYLDMVAAAKKDGVKISIGSAFRSPYDSINEKSESGVRVQASSQKYLHDGYIAKKKGFNKAAAPGNSNHGNGIAIDTNAGGKSSGRFINVNKDVYIWLVKNSWKYGFIRSVTSEEWHYDYLPDLAKKGPYGKIAGTDANKFYSTWGLDKLV